MRPTILFVTEIQPYPLYGGMYIGIYNVLESLCKNYDVVVLSPPVEEACPLREQVVAWYPLPIYPTDLRHKVQNGLYVLQPRPEWRTVLVQILQRHKPDGVWFTYGHWGQYAPLVHQFGAFAVMMTHNVQSQLTNQRAAIMPLGLLHMLTRFRAWAEAHHERILFRHFDRVISLTEIDRRYHAQFVSDERSILIPGYLDASLYQHDTKMEREEKLLILTGSFNSFQNSQGALWFLREIWPQICRTCPAVRLQLVGKGADQLPIPNQVGLGVETIDNVADIVPYLRQATVAVVPILHGSGIRFKVLEALAAELPVVSTHLGAQGIAVVQGESILLADDANLFAQAVIDLLQDAALRSCLAHRGHAVFLRKYTTAVNTRRIAHLITQLCQVQAQRPAIMLNYESVSQ
ncbi:MAG: glycosyltransferase [Caldilineaceae bacterium]|nr:glycosyltransferase [Caldilineaceae bacterium]